MIEMGFTKLARYLFFVLLLSIVSCSAKKESQSGITEDEQSRITEEQLRVAREQNKMAAQVPPAQNLRDANVLLSMQRCAEAIISYRRFLEKYPKDAWAWNLIGLAFLCNSQFDEAVSAFHTSLAIQPTYTDLHNNLGIAYMQMKNYPEAKKEFIKALEDPNYSKAGPYYNLSKLAYLQGSYEESRALAKKSLEYVPKTQNGLPKEPGPQLLLAHSLHRLNRLQEAEVAFHDLLKIDPNNLEACYAMGSILLQKNEQCMARTYFEKVVDADPLGQLGQQSIEVLKNLQCVR